jgi:hypothetical protein
MLKMKHNNVTFIGSTSALLSALFAWILTFPAAMISAIQFFGSGAQVEVIEQKYKTQLSNDTI